MANINYTTREMTIKVVYYGPAFSGKTANLEYIQKQIPPEKKGKLLSLKTEEDRTVFFDLLPVDVGTLGGLRVRVQLFTTPGAIKYDATRQVVMRSADGLVFVADSQAAMMDYNIESLKSLQQNLKLNHIDFDTIPMVIQYNKQDLSSLSSLEELERRLNVRKAPNFPAAATKGQGIMETYQAIIKNVVESLQKGLNLTLPPLSTPLIRPAKPFGPEQIRVVATPRSSMDLEDDRLFAKTTNGSLSSVADIPSTALTQFQPQQMAIIEDIRLRVNKLLADNNKIAGALKKILTQMSEISEKIDSKR